MISAILTVHDREPELLLSCLRSLRRSSFDGEVVIVDDRSQMSYDWARDYIASSFEASQWISTGPYDGYRADGYGNPARAFNMGLLAATGDQVLIMSSDIIVTPDAMTKAIYATRLGMPWTPKVIDLDSGKEYCGPSRFYPMPWFLLAPKQACLEVGGWDEAYLDGLCFEDNDFVSRVGIKCGRILADWTATVWHHSHHQPAYTSETEIREANKRNELLTRRKWAGIPFDGEMTPFDVRRRPHESGCQSLEFSAGDLLDRIVPMTRGIVADAHLRAVPVPQRA